MNPVGLHVKFNETDKKESEWVSITNAYKLKEYQHKHVLSFGAIKEYYHPNHS
jgi:hypothetical protein